MTIKELIEQLQKYDENKQIEIACTYDCGYGIAGGSIIEIIDKGSHIELFNDEY